MLKRKSKTPLPPGVMRVVSRGREYFYFQSGRGWRHEGERIKLPHIADPEFKAAYRKACGMHAHGAPGTFENLIAQYKQSPEWADLSDASQRDYGRYLAKIQTLFGDLPVKGITTPDIVALRDKGRDRPASTNYMIRVLSAILAWGRLREGFRSDNPASRIPKLKIGPGWPPWPMDAIDKFEAEGPRHIWDVVATALYTGQRQSDVIAMSWDRLTPGGVWVRQEKTDSLLLIPIHQNLIPIFDARKRAWEALPADQKSNLILTTKRHTAWTADGLRTSFGKAMTKLGMPDELTFHGLRKSAVVMLLEAGCTDAEVAAITGQTRKMIEHYSLMVNQQKLAAAAILKWELQNGLQNNESERKEMVD